MDFKTFLSKYSEIDSKFLDKYFAIFSEELILKRDEFVIDLDLLCDFLRVSRKDGLTATLKRSYRLNKDYITHGITDKKGSGGHNKKIYMLTPFAAKRLCLSTRSPMGPVIRAYFIEMEFVLYKYHKYIIKGLRRKMRQLENK